MKSIRNYHFFLLAVAALAAANTGNAQSIPGHWYRVALPQAVRGPGDDNTQDFGFKDSLNGICVSDHGLISSTINGGRSWILDRDLSGDVDIKSNLNSIECTAPHHGFVNSSLGTLSISPTGTILLGPPNWNEVNEGAYATLAEKMYDTAYGFRLVEYESTEDAQQYEDSVVIIVTHDGWQSSAIYGSAYILSPDSTYAEVTTQVMLNGYIVDSNDVWTSKSSIVLHTTNGGAQWLTIDAVDTTRYRPSFIDFFVNHSTSQIFSFGHSGAFDFAYSSDYGSTWSIDSTFGVSLWRLANPAPGILWAMISQGGIANIEIFPPGNVFPPVHKNEYSRKIGYSSDNGLSWLIDSTTFIDDSLEEMHFTDARHGWVASWSHDSLFMWYYDADEASVVVEHHSAPIIPSTIKPVIYPNPASVTIAVVVTGQTGQMMLLDAIGREIQKADIPSSGELEFDIRSLPTGLYFLVAGSVASQFVKE